MTTAPRPARIGWWPLAAALGVTLSHALFLRHLAATATPGWANVTNVPADLWGFGPYLRNQDYYTTLSYAMAAAFSAWALARFLRTRSTAAAVGAAGGVTLAGALAALGCFLIGCCGSPMLAVYAGLFGGKLAASLGAGLGKMLMAGITLLSIGIGYWLLTRRPAACACGDGCGCGEDGNEACGCGEGCECDEDCAGDDACGCDETCDGASAAPDVTA